MDLCFFACCVILLCGTCESDVSFWSRRNEMEVAVTGHAAVLLADLLSLQKFTLICNADLQVHAVVILSKASILCLNSSLNKLY